jgi:hypothetical protein
VGANSRHWGYTAFLAFGPNPRVDAIASHSLPTAPACAAVEDEYSIRLAGPQVLGFEARKQNTARLKPQNLLVLRQWKRTRGGLQA